MPSLTQSKIATPPRSVGRYGQLLSIIAVLAGTLCGCAGNPLALPNQRSAVLPQTNATNSSAAVSQIVDPADYADNPNAAWQAISQQTRAHAPAPAQQHLANPAAQQSPPPRSQFPVQMASYQEQSPTLPEPQPIPSEHLHPTQSANPISGSSRMVNPMDSPQMPNQGIHHSGQSRANSPYYDPQGNPASSSSTYHLTPPPQSSVHLSPTNHFNNQSQTATQGSYHGNPAPLNGTVIQNSNPTYAPQQANGYSMGTMSSQHSATIGHYPGSTTGQNGVNLVGSEFRPVQPTATEIMIQLKDENKLLREKIAAMDADIRGLKEMIQREQTEHKRTQHDLDTSEAQNQKLMEMIAKLQVQVENLSAEKSAIKQNADAALREIESNLDAVLLNSITNNKGSNSLRSGN